MPTKHQGIREQFNPALYTTGSLTLLPRVLLEHVTKSSHALQYDTPNFVVLIEIAEYASVSWMGSNYP